MLFFNKQNNIFLKIIVKISKFIRLFNEFLVILSKYESMIQEGINTLNSLRFMLSRPGILTVLLLNKEIGENMDIINFKVVLPQLLDESVVKRELTVQIADNPIDTQIVDALIGEIDGFKGPQDSTVKLALIDIDEAGNRSEASLLEVVLVDRFPPAKPGELGITQTGEVRN